MKLFLTLSLLLLLPSLALAESEWKWGEIPREQFFVTHFPEAPQADAVVLLDHGTVRVDPKPRLKYLRHHRTRIMKEAGVDRGVVRIEVPLGAEIKNFRAHTLVPPGHPIKVEKNGIEKREGPEGGEWIVTFPDVKPGVVVEYQYELRTDRLDYIPSWHFRNPDFTVLSRFELQLQPGMTHDAFFGWTPGVAPSPVRTDINDPDNTSRQITQWAWQQESQHPVPDLPYVRNPEDYRVTLYVQLRDVTASSKTKTIRIPWEQLAVTASERQALVLKDTKGVDAWAAEATAGAPDVESQARALHRRIRDGIATSESPLQGTEPATLRQVIESGSGSPLAKNVLLAEALRSQEIEARVVRVRVGSELQPRWPCLEQLNHSLVRVDLGGQVVWADANAPYAGFGALPIADHVTQGLLTGAGGGLVAVEVPAIDSERTVVTEGTLDAQGTLIAKAEVHFRGYPAMAARTSLAVRSENEFVAGVLRERFGTDATLVSFEVTGGDGVADAPLDVALEYRVPDWARRNGEKITGELPWLFAMAPGVLASEDREIPIDFGYAGGTRETVRLQLPDGFFVLSVPDRKTARMTEMNYKSTHAMERTSLESTREVNVREAVIAESDFEKLQKVWDKAAAADAATFTVGRQPVRTTGTR